MKPELFQAISLRLNNMSYREIAAELHVSQASIASVAKQTTDYKTVKLNRESRDLIMEDLSWDTLHACPKKRFIAHAIIQQLLQM